MSQKPKTIKASDFKAKCLALLDEVARTGETIVITKNGKPVVDLVPHRAKKRSGRSALGVWKGQVEIIGDIVSPIYAGLKTSMRNSRSAAPETIEAFGRTV